MGVDSKQATSSLIPTIVPLSKVVSHIHLSSPPSVIPLFLTPPPSFCPILCHPCGSSIYQPPGFSLYLTLEGSAAYIKYLKTDSLVQQPGNHSTERERQRERISSLPICFSAPPGRGVSGIACRVGEPHSPRGYHWACVGGHHRVNSVVWMSKLCGSRCGERRGREEKATWKNKRRRRRYVVSVWEEIFKLG